MSVETDPKSGGKGRLLAFPKRLKISSPIHFKTTKNNFQCKIVRFSVLDNTFSVTSKYNRNLNLMSLLNCISLS